MHEVQINHVTVIVELLTESVGQAGEPTHRHSHGEVLAFHVARAYVFGIRSMLGECKLEDNLAPLRTYKSFPKDGTEHPSNGGLTAGSRGHC
jgi:hypothetical protein